MDIALYDLEDRIINIGYSNIIDIDGAKSLYVYFSRQNNRCYDTAVCEYPSLLWYDVHGFDNDDMDLLKDFMECHSKNIINYIEDRSSKIA